MHIPFIVAVSLALLTACGSAPLALPADDAGPDDGGELVYDGGVDAGSSAGFDGGGGVTRDGGISLPGDGGGLPGDGGTTTLDAGTSPPRDGGPPRPAGPFPPNGWLAASAFNGRVVPWDLSTVDEDALLLPGGRGALYAIGSGYDDHHPEREPLIYVHGLTGAPKDEQSIVDRLWWSTRYQLFTFAFNDFNKRTSLNGDDLAAQVRALAGYLTSHTRITIVAHSLGGMVARWAIDQLALGTAGGLELYSGLRFFGIDNPWHGFDGPADGPAMDIARLLMPDGLEDMRALSPMFNGDPAATDPVLRAGLLGAPLPANVSIDLAFAQAGDLITDYSEGTMSDLPQRIATAYLNGNALQGDEKHQHFWNALRGAATFPALDDELRQHGGALDAATVLAALLRHYPRFPGDHTGILDEHPGERSYLDYLTESLAP